MANAMANFLRAEVDLNKQASKLGHPPRVRTQQEIELFLLNAANEIDRLETGPCHYHSLINLPCPRCTKPVS